MADEERNVRFLSTEATEHPVTVTPAAAEARTPTYDIEEEFEEEEEEEEVDDDEEDRALQKRVRAIYEHQQHESAKQPASPPDSTDSNGFVKLEKPQDLFSGTQPEVAVRLQPREEITPSDDVAAPFGDDLRDFAVSPQHAAEGLAERTHQTLGDFLAVTDDNSSRLNTAREPPLVSALDEEDTAYRRQGPLTLARAPDLTPTSLHHDGMDNLVDRSPSPNYYQQAPLEPLKASPELPTDYDRFPSELEEEFVIGRAEDEPEPSPLLPPVRPPTPPKPRPGDAPTTPPVLELGGSPHEYHAPAPTHGGRKSSLRVTSHLGVVPPANFSHKIGVTTSAPWLDMKRWDSNVLDLIYWRDPRKSGVVFGVTLLFLICLAVFNAVTVLSYSGLLVLTGTVSLRVYTAVMAAVQKTEQTNPFKALLDVDLHLPQDRVHEHVDVFLKHVQDLLHQLRRLFLVEDMWETLKFFLFLWSLTYVGAYFTGTALVIIAFVGLFTLPKVYELYQPQIDNYYTIAESKYKQAHDATREQLDKVPYLKRKAQPKQD